jgi:GTP-binding protein
VDGYFSSGRNVSFVAHLVDFRHGPLAADEELTCWLDRLDMPRFVIFTKGDKVPRGRAKGAYAKYSGGLASVLPPAVTSGKNDGAADDLRGAIPMAINELNNI